MKRLYLLFIFITSCFQLSAQEDYRPFVEEGKTWNYIIYTNHYEYDEETGKEIQVGFPARLVIEGDTTIEDVEYKKIMHYSDVLWTDENPSKDFLYAVIREMDKKVYFRHLYYANFDHSLEPGNEALIYDFGLKIGDIFVEDFFGNPFYWATKLKLESIEEKDGKRLFFFSINNNSTRQWVEGVGGCKGLGLEERFDNPTCNDCTLYFPTLVSCTLGDEVLCRFDEDGNVVLGVDEIKTIDGKDGAIYDLQGRRLNAEPERGLYIKDGKKIAR
ncbi:MAG: hypothetical protein ILA29_09125 [Prevotella sp.]|nr:hypothetical protein [Prevotella sp.]